MDSIKGISQDPSNMLSAGKGPGAKKEDFLKTLKSFYNNVDMQLKEADQKVGDFAVGKKQGLHEIMIASEKANISFKLLLQIRNKFLEAYREIMRMQF
jgi:flagellar hook-basal body complex protein FliE